MKKILSLILMLILVTVGVAGCGNTKTEEDTTAQTTEAKVEPADINMASLKGPTSIGLVKLMSDNESKEAGNNYTFNIYGTADEITTGLIKGDIDIAAVPCNLASVLYNKTQGEIQVAAINTLGVIYMVATDDSIQGAEDLKGKTIYSTGQGTTPEYTLNYILEKNGLDPKTDVNIEYKTEAAEVVALLSANPDSIAMLPQPFVTTAMANNPELKIVLDMTEEWDNVSEDGSSVVTGVIVVRKAFLEENEDAFKVFLSEYEESTNYAVNEIDKTAALVEHFDIFKAEIAKKAIPYCNIVCIQGEEMKTKISGYLESLYNQNPASVGGELPENDFYY